MYCVLQSRIHNEELGIRQSVAGQVDARAGFLVNLVSKHILEMNPALKPFGGYIPIFPAMTAGNLLMFFHYLTVGRRLGTCLFAHFDLESAARPCEIHCHDDEPKVRLGCLLST
jgi:hypothetical protein